LRVLQQAVDRGVPGEALHEGPACPAVLLAGPKEGLQKLHVRHQVDQRVAGEVLASAATEELAGVPGEGGGGEVLAAVRLVGPSGGQAARLYRGAHAPAPERERGSQASRG